MSKRMKPVDHRPFTGAAAGLQAVKKSIEMVHAEAGMVRGTRALATVNQLEGFDCPGCAWPDPDHRSMAEFCENGAKAVAEEATRHTVGQDFFERYSCTELAGKDEFWLGKQGRITSPMFKAANSDHYRPITWDEAIQHMVDRLLRLDSPDRAVFYTSGRASNEAAFLYQLIARLFGTNNLPDCSNMCHESSGCALTETIGAGKGTVSLKDFDHADLILVIGQNPGTNHPRMLTTLQAAARRGAKIVTINPLKEPALVRFKHPQEIGRLLGSGTPITTHYYQVAIGGDAAFLQGVMKALLELDESLGGAIDHDFVQRHTDGFETLRATIAGRSWDDLERICGLPRRDMQELALLYRASRACIACWAMGLTQHKNAVATIQDIVSLLLLRGNMGRQGAGACPVRGHSNVQGDRTMGIYEKPRPAFLDRLGASFGFQPPRHHGYDVVDAIRAMREGKVGFFLALGGNFISATPDTHVTEEAVRKCGLTVQVSTKLNRSHGVTGQEALILPCLGRSDVDRQESGEQFVTVEDSMSVVHRSRGRLAPVSDDLLSEPAILCRLASALFRRLAASEAHDSSARERARAACAIEWDSLAKNYDQIRDMIERAIPGFESFNKRVREDPGFVLPNPGRDRSFLEGKAKFIIEEPFENKLAAGQRLLMTIRTHDQFNTTIYGMDDRYRGIYGERRVLLMNAGDMKEDGVVDGQLVDITSHFRGETRTVCDFVVIGYDIPRRCAATYFPEANPLVHLDSTADKSQTPASKAVVVTIRPSGARS